MRGSTLPRAMDEPRADELDAIADMLASRASRRRADRRGHLDRVGHPRLPRAQRRVDQESRRREDRATSSTTSPIRPCARRRGRTGCSSEIWQAEPNAGHRALAELERLVALRRAPHAEHRRPAPRRGQLAPTHRRAARQRARGEVPELRLARPDGRDPRTGARPVRPTLACLECGGILKSATISFGEHARRRRPRARPARPRRAATCSSPLGTSLGVYPAAALPEIALRNGARLIVMNAEPTPFDAVADVVVRTPLGEALPARRRALGEYLSAKVGFYPGRPSFRPPPLSRSRRCRASVIC